MESERKIVLLSDFIEQKVRKEKELEYYTQQLEELQKIPTDQLLEQRYQRVMSYGN